MSESYEGAGKRIQDLRQIERYMREELAEIADISPKFIYEIETGKKFFGRNTFSYR